MTDTTKILPKLRFPEFENDGEWEMQALGNCLLQAPDYGLNAPAVPYSPSLPTYLRITDIDDNGRFITDKKMSVDAEITEKNSLKAGDIVFARTGASVGKVYKYRVEDGSLIFAGFLIRVRPDNSKYCSDYIFQYLFTEAYKRWINITSSRSGQPGINSNEYASLPIPFPSLPEQQKIAAFLTSLDEQISAHTKKLEALKAHKKGLMQQLFPANGEKTPKLRFPEFRNDREWKNTTLGQITNVINRRNKSKRDLPIYSISNKNGFILQNEQFDGLDSNKRGYDISMYKIVGKNTFAYNPARINVGSIGYSGNLSEIQISSLYVCFKTTEDVDDSFLLCFFDSFKFSNAVESNVEGGIRSYLFYENFSKIRIGIPSISEQKKIASCFNTINEIIKNNSEKLNALEQQKKGLMQQLFPICFK